jgi:hypothetical protein
MFTPQVCEVLAGKFAGAAEGDDAIERVIIVGIEVSRRDPRGGP